MYGMYFNASERIASDTAYSRSLIEKVDAFLASSDLLRFDLGQASDLVGSDRDLQAVLAEYVRLRVLKSEVEYLCPIHNVRLEPKRGRVAKCIDCERDYPLEDCKIRNVCVRVLVPDTLPKPAADVPEQLTATNRPWYQKPEIIVPVVVAIAVGILSFIGNLLSADTIVISPTDTPASTLPAVVATAALIPNVTITVLPTSTVVVEATLEVTVEPTKAP